MERTIFISLDKRGHIGNPEMQQENIKLMQEFVELQLSKKNGITEDEIRACLAIADGISCVKMNYGDKLACINIDDIYTFVKETEDMYSHDNAYICDILTNIAENYHENRDKGSYCTQVDDALREVIAEEQGATAGTDISSAIENNAEDLKAKVIKNLAERFKSGKNNPEAISKFSKEILALPKNIGIDVRRVLAQLLDLEVADEVVDSFKNNILKLPYFIFSQIQAMAPEEYQELLQVAIKQLTEASEKATSASLNTEENGAGFSTQEIPQPNMTVEQQAQMKRVQEQGQQILQQQDQINRNQAAIMAANTLAQQIQTLHAMQSYNIGANIPPYLLRCNNPEPEAQQEVAVDKEDGLDKLIEDKAKTTKHKSTIDLEEVTPA